jgi:hypothetical protein
VDDGTSWYQTEGEDVPRFDGSGAQKANSEGRIRGCRIIAIRRHGLAPNPFRVNKPVNKSIRDTLSEAFHHMSCS